MCEEALQIAEKRREAKGKGEKERYTHWNAEFQRIARRDKKAFLSDQCKGREENSRMGKTRFSSRKSECLYVTYIALVMEGGSFGLERDYAITEISSIGELLGTLM